MARTILFALLFSAANAITEPTEPITEADVAAVQQEWSDEDKGFALAPYTAVRWENQGTIFHGDSATAMGEYYFTDAGGGVTKAEYTFQYAKAADGSLKIVVHHSSLPFVKTLPLDPENETTYAPRRYPAT
ncbi:hypothetical protein JL722_81 [Aureococcus anophagefferens]|nr:hypothetical protein JL722_81 [Aureococcus anophagefferens]